MSTQPRGGKERRRYEKRIAVDATPEQLIHAIVTTPPKKPNEWNFVRKGKDGGK